MNETTLKLTQDEVNVVASALGARPFVEVFQLIAKIQRQVAEQAPPTSPAA